MRRRDIWSATRIDAANYCRMRYYLIYVEGEKRLNLSAYEKGSLLHKMIEDFWTIRNGEKVPRYSSADEFAMKTRGKWMQRIIGAEKSGRKIEWKTDDEKWMIRNTLPEICTSLYNCLLEEGPPMYSELPFEFSFINKNRRLAFRGRIDEVRKRGDEIVLRDYKSGNPWIGEMKVKHDPQMTLYNVGLCALCYADSDFARSLGLENDARKFMGNPIYICEKIHPEFFMVEMFRYKDKKNPPIAIHKTERKDEHFFELIRMIEGTIDAVERGNIYPERGRKCDSCDVKNACAKRVDLARNLKSGDETGQFVFEFSAPLFQQGGSPPEKPRVLQRRFRLRKKDNTLVPF